MICGKGRYSLRRMRRQDLPDVLRWRNDPKVRSVSHNQETIAWSDHVAWFDRVDADEHRLQMIFEIDGRPVGVVGFDGVGSTEGVITWSFYLGERDLPAGTGTRMLALALDVAFDRLDARKVRGEVLDNNVASIAVHKRLGFTEESAGADDGDSAGVAVFGILAEEWTRASATLEDALFKESWDGQ